MIGNKMSNDNIVCYADDAVLLATKEDDSQSLCVNLTIHANNIIRWYLQLKLKQWLLL